MKEELKDMEELETELPKKKEKKKKEVDLLKEQIRELEDKNLRVTAEMQNIKRRNMEEIAKIYKYDGEELAHKILPILDNFERALSMTNETNESFVNGFKMIYTSLIKALEEKGIQEIICLNEAFDPNSMDAITTESREGIESDIVIEVLQKGYIYNDKVLRPAMVKVSE